MGRIKLFVWYWMPLILYAGLIFYMSSQPTIPSTAAVSINDKLLHVMEYLILSFLLYRIINTTYPNSAPYFAFALSTFYGISDEFHQSFVPGRVMSVYDVIADMIGSFLIFLFVKIKKVGKHALE